MTTDRIALVATALVPLRNRATAVPVTWWPTARSCVASVASAIERRSREALARRRGEQVGVLEHTHHLAAHGEHRHVPQPALQHLHQHAVGGQVCGHGARRCAHHRGDGDVDGAPAATTRVRRSRSVKMPRPPSGSRINA